MLVVMIGSIQLVMILCASVIDRTARLRLSVGSHEGVICCSTSARSRLAARKGSLHVITSRRPSDPELNSPSMT